MGVAAAESKQAALAGEEAAAAKARLAKAEELMNGGGKSAAAMNAEVEKAKKDYELAKEKYTKEANDVKAVQKRVAMAKAELAKWEQSSARVVAPTIVALLLGLMSF